MSSAVARARTLPAPQQGASRQSTSGGELLPLLAAFAALGAGLTFCALSADALLSADSAAGVGLGVAAGLWAVAHLAWGIGALRNPTGGLDAGTVPARAVPAALPAAAAVVLGSLVWTALLAPAADRELNLTLVSALALILLQLGCHGALRRRAEAGATGTQAQPGRLLAGLFFSAVLVAGMTTPGLAASTAGDNAVPHGEHGTTPAGHGNH